MRRYIVWGSLLVLAVVASAGKPAEAATAKILIDPTDKYVATADPTFTVDVRVENVSTPQMQVIYGESNVDTDLALGSDPAVKASYAETNVDTDLAIGNVAANGRRGQGFRVTETTVVNRVLLWVKKVGAPLDGVRVEVQGDSGGLPNGVALSESVIASGEEDITTSYSWIPFDLSSPPVLSPGTQYHLVVKRTSPLGPDPDDYFVWGGDMSAPSYANGTASVYNGSTWATVSADHAFKVDTNALQRAQGFKVPTNTPVNRVLLWLKRVGSLTGTDGFLNVEFYDDAGGIPGTSLASSTSIDVSLIGTSYDWVVFSMLAAPQLTAGTQYHLVLKWTDVPDAPNYIAWGADASSPGYGDGVAAAYYGGSSWLAASPAADQAFEVAYACLDEFSEPGPCGLGGFEIRIVFDESKVTFNSFAVGLFLESTGRTLFPCSNPIDHDPTNGLAAYKCSTTGGTPLGPEGAGVLATATFTSLMAAGNNTPLDLGDTVLTDINNTPLTHTKQGNTIRAFTASGDQDGDGCTDLQEAGDNPLLGGDRNPFNRYDFYDITNITGVIGATDKGVSGFDLNMLLAWGGVVDNGPPNLNGKDYDDDNNSNTIEDGLEMDFAAISGPATGPDGGISGFDLNAMLSQGGHSCA